LKKIICIIHGGKKLKKHSRLFIAACSKEFGSAFELFYSTKLVGAKKITADNLENTSHIIGVGGDGILNEIINGLPFDSLVPLPIVGIIPNGTGNDFYRSAGYTGSTHYLEAIKNDLFDWVDLGSVTADGQKRYFINISDIGFGGSAVLELDRFKGFLGGKFAYGLSILYTFLSYKKLIVTIKSGDFIYHGPLLMAAFCNGSIFGNGLHIHPKAKINDGQLKLTLLGKVSLWDYIKNVVKVKRGKQIVHPEAHYLSLENEAELMSCDGVIFAETDGEGLSGQRFQIKLIPNSLRIIKVL
jgi:YegS/Rv2252/BmrU family lipid kinase